MTLELGFAELERVGFLVKARGDRSAARSTRAAGHSPSSQAQRAPPTRISITFSTWT